MNDSFDNSNETVLCQGITLDNRGNIVNTKKYILYTNKLNFPYLDNWIENGLLFPFEYYQSSSNSYKVDFHITPDKDARNHVVGIASHLFPQADSEIMTWNNLMESLMIPLITVGVEYSEQKLSRMSLYYFSPNEKGKKSEQISLCPQNKMDIINHIGLVDEILIQFIMMSDLKIVAIDINHNNISTKFYCSWNKSNLRSFLQKYWPDIWKTLFDVHFFEKNFLLTSIVNSALSGKKLGFYYE